MGAAKKNEESIVLTQAEVDALLMAESESKIILDMSKYPLADTVIKSELISESEIVRRLEWASGCGSNNPHYIVQPHPDSIVNIYFKVHQLPVSFCNLNVNTRNLEANAHFDKFIEHLRRTGHPRGFIMYWDLDTAWYFGIEKVEDVSQEEPGNSGVSEEYKSFGLETNDDVVLFFNKFVPKDES